MVVSNQVKLTSLELATIPYKCKNIVPYSINDILSFIQKTNDSDINGLVNLMAEELQSRRRYGVYLSGNSPEPDFSACKEDSALFLSRYLLDESANGNLCVNFSDGKIKWIGVKAKLQEMAYCCGNWVQAERKYAQSGLDYIVKINTPTQVHNFSKFK